MNVRLPAAIKHTLMYGFSIALMKGVSLLMLPILAYFLTADEFGRLEVITSLAVIGSILVGMGLEATLFRFVGETENVFERKRIAAEIFSLAMIVGLVSAFIGWSLAEYVAAYLPGDASTYEIRLTFLILSLEGCIAIPLGWLRMHDRVTSFFFITTGRAIIQALLTAFMLWLGGGVAEILEASLIAAMTAAIVLVFLQIKDTQLGLKSSTIRKSLIYSIPLVASGIVAFGLNGLDRLILAEYSTLIDVAHFGVAAKFSLAVILLLQPFNMWWLPRRFSVLNQSDGPEKVARFITIGIILTLTISVFVSTISPLIIKWLLPESYVISAQYVIGLVIVMACKEIADLLNIGCFTGETTASQLMINIAAVTIGVSCMLLWTSDYAVWGVIYALIAAQVVRLVLFCIISQHFLPLNYPTLPLLLFACFSITLILLSGLTSGFLIQITSLFFNMLLLIISAMILKLIPRNFKVQ
jgi:O-antigen/teichoic acid export membrane protein